MILSPKFQNNPEFLYFAISRRAIKVENNENKGYSVKQKYVATPWRFGIKRGMRGNANFDPNPKKQH